MYLYGAFETRMNIVELPLYHMLLAFNCFMIFIKHKVGWHEQDPIEIWHSVCHCVNVVHNKLQDQQVKAIGITNQRETLIAWNSRTGMPYYNAIVWDDLRTTTIAQQIAKEAPSASVSDKPSDRLRAQTGLPLASYFSGTKLRWLIENVSQLRADLTSSSERDHVRFGTIDTWLVYNLTGSSLAVGHVANIGGIHVTDVTNASRWLLMDLYKCQWDAHLIKIVCGAHKNPVVPIGSLPVIKSSSEVYGICSVGCGIKSLEKVPIASILGDQQAALFGQAGFNRGDAKVGAERFCCRGQSILFYFHGYICFIVLFPLIHLNVSIR